MNSPDPEDDAFLHRVASLPRPALRDTARQRSLEAALATVAGASSPHANPAPAHPAAASDTGSTAAGLAAHATPSRRRRRFPRISRLHLSSMAACWALAGYFHLSAPGAPENPGTSPAAGYSAWPGPFHPDADSETTKLLADLYPARNWNIE